MDADEIKEAGESWGCVVIAVVFILAVTAYEIVKLVYAGGK